MIRNSKIRRAVQESLHLRTPEPIQVWDTEHHPPRLAAEPEAVGELFPKCLASLGADPSVQVDEGTLASYIARVPKYPPGTSAKPPRSPDVTWFSYVTSLANPAKATGEDYMNYSVVSICPPAVKSLLLRAMTMIVHESPPFKWPASRVCFLYKKGDPRRAENYRPICLIETLVKLSAAWPCKHLTSEAEQHSLIQPCRHGGLANHRCRDHIYDVMARMLQSKGRLCHLYINLKKRLIPYPSRRCGAPLRVLVSLNNSLVPHTPNH